MSIVEFNSILENTDLYKSLEVSDAAWIVRPKRTDVKILKYFDWTQGP